MAPFTEVHNTPNKSVRQNVARLGVVLHHAAMTNLDTLIYLEMGAKQVSSSATCKDDRLPQMMPFETFRAWSLSDAYWDSALRSVETCNESVVGWTVSDASHWSLAKAVAYWAKLDGFYPHRNGDPKSWTVLGHREVYTIHGGSYGTACPGGMDLDLVTRRAQSLLAGTAGGGSTPIIEEEITAMEMYIKVPDGRVLHVSNGVKVIFGSAQEYANWRNIVSTYKSVTPGATNVVPPDISQVMGVTWDGYTQIMSHFGVAA